MFHQTSKFHTMWPIGYESYFGNPAFSTCYTNEDFMAKIGTIGDSARHGQSVGLRSKAIASKYCFGRSLELSNEGVRNAGASITV